MTRQDEAASATGDAARDRPPPGRRRWAGLDGPRPIGVFLFLLIAVTIIPAISVSVVLLIRHNEAQREVVTTLAEATAASIAEAVDRELVSMVTTLRIFSSSPVFLEGDLRQFHRRATAALEGTGTHFIVLDENFDQLMNTRVPFGTPLGATSDPASARRALETRSTVISDVFFGKTASKWVFNAILPHVPAGEPPRVMILTRDAETMSQALAEQTLRGGWNASIVDGAGTVIASSFISSDIGKPFFLDIGDGSGTMRGRRGPEVRPESYEAIVEQSGFSNWRVVLWAPTAMVEEPMRRSLRTLVVGGLLVIAIGASAAWLLGRHIAKPVRRLARDARRLGAGEPVEAVGYPIAEISTVSAALADAAADRRKAENDIRLLMREVAHRAKNQLTVVASIAKQSARNARSFAAFQDTFQKRLYGLARSTDLLIAGGAAGVELRDLLEAQIEPFRPDRPKRLRIEGPHFRLSSQAAQTIGLAIHELATNASKYGAFAVAEGRLDVTWTVADEKLTIVWRETVQRLRRRPAKRGFGTEIIERMLGGTLEAEITRTFHRDGLECVMRMPVARIVPGDPDQVSRLMQG